MKVKKKMKWQKLSSVLQVQDGILDPIPYGHMLVASMHLHTLVTIFFYSSEKKNRGHLLEYKFTKSQRYSWEAAK